MKTCTKCGETKSLESFGYDKKGKDKLRESHEIAQRAADYLKNKGVKRCQ